MQKRKSMYFLVQNNLSGWKPKDLRKAFKSFTLPNKSDRYKAGALVKNQILKHDIKSILKHLKNISFKSGRKFIGNNS